MWWAGCVWLELEPKRSQITLQQREGAASELSLLGVMGRSPSAPHGFHSTNSFFSFVSFHLLCLNPLIIKEETSAAQRVCWLKTKGEWVASLVSYLGWLPWAVPAPITNNKSMTNEATNSSINQRQPKKFQQIPLSSICFHFFFVGWLDWAGVWVD